MNARCVHRPRLKQAAPKSALPQAGGQALLGLSFLGSLEVAQGCASPTSRQPAESSPTPRPERGGGSLGGAQRGQPGTLSPMGGRGPQSPEACTARGPSGTFPCRQQWQIV